MKKTENGLPHIGKRKKNRIRYVIIILIIITFSIFIWYNYIKTNIYKIDTKSNYEETEFKTEEKFIDKESNQEKKKEKNIANFKKEIIAKWLIAKWYAHLENKDYLLALQKFSKANKETPNNQKILSEIAEVYFLMKNYKSAYRYYLKINEKEYTNKNNMALSLIYKEKIEDNNFDRNWEWTLINTWTILKIKKLKKEIKNIGLDEDNKFYYLNSLECLNNFKNCKINFQNYFKNESYLWDNENLERIKVAIDNYKTLKLDEIYYKDTLIIWAFFENKNYPVSIVLSREILKDRENYKSILKILAQSYFELNKLEQANKFLIEYAKIDSKSSDVYYMIWTISQKNNDYIKSNIFLNLALEQEYKNVENIYKMQLYNYLILDQNEKITETFDKIIALKEKPDSNDLILATYYSIINNQKEKADLLADKWLELYPEKEDFYWFKAWIKIENNDLEEAMKLLNKAKEINNRNALVVLNLWRISKIKYEKGGNSFNKTKARFLFKKAMELDSDEIWELAEIYLAELEELEEK